MIIEMMAIMIGIMIFMVMVLASRYVKVPPNKAMVVFGHRFQGGEGIMILTGGGRFIMPIIESWEWLDLSILTLNLKVDEIVTRDLKLVNLECVAQVQIDPSEDGLRMHTVQEQHDAIS